MIAVHQLAKTFGTGATAATVLHDVSLQVREGEVYGVIGRSGAGKCTLIRCVNLLERPTSGPVIVAGQDSPPCPRRAAARRAAGSAWSSSTSTCCPRAPCRQRRAAAGDGRASRRERAGARRRTAGPGRPRRQGATATPPSSPAARSSASASPARSPVDPKVLLSDEATSALDPETTRSILQLLRDLNQQLGLTVLLITHEMAVVGPSADRVAVLDAGRVVEQGAGGRRVHPAARRSRAACCATWSTANCPGVLRAAVPPAGAVRAPAVLRCASPGRRPRRVLSEVVRRFGLDSTSARPVDHIQRPALRNVIVVGDSRPAGGHRGRPRVSSAAAALEVGGARTCRQRCAAAPPRRPETLVMVGVSALIARAGGLPLGVCWSRTERGQVLETRRSTGCSARW